MWWTELFYDLAIQSTNTDHKTICTSECDQIWQNFTILAKTLKSWAIFGKLLTYFGTFYAIGQILIRVSGQKMEHNFGHTGPM